MAVLQALASTVNRVSRSFRFLYLTQVIIHLMFILLHYSQLNCCGSRKFLRNCLIQSLHITNEESKAFNSSDLGLVRMLKP